MDNTEKLVTRLRQTKQKTQHNMCWTPLYTMLIKTIKT